MLTAPVGKVGHRTPIDFSDYAARVLAALTRVLRSAIVWLWGHGGYSWLAWWPALLLLAGAALRSGKGSDIDAPLVSLSEGTSDLI